MKVSSKREFNSMVGVLTGVRKIDNKILDILCHKDGAQEFYKNFRSFIIGRSVDGTEDSVEGGLQLMLTALYANFVVDWDELTDYGTYVLNNKQQTTCMTDSGILKTWRQEQLVYYILSLYTGDKELINKHKEYLLAPYSEKEPQEIIGRGHREETYVALPILANGRYVKYGAYSVNWSGRVIIAHDVPTDIWGSYGKNGWTDRKGDLNLFQAWVLNLLLFDEKNTGLYDKITELKTKEH